MITGDEEITKGDAYLNSTSIKTNIKKFQVKIILFYDPNLLIYKGYSKKRYYFSLTLKRKFIWDQYL